MNLSFSQLDTILSTTASSPAWSGLTLPYTACTPGSCISLESLSELPPSAVSGSCPLSRPIPVPFHPRPLPIPILAVRSDLILSIYTSPHTAHHPDPGPPPHLVPSPQTRRLLLFLLGLFLSVHAIFFTGQKLYLGPHRQSFNPSDHSTQLSSS